MTNSSVEERPDLVVASGPLRETPVDWEALEDAFENNAPEVHSYLHLTTGEVLRVVDGVADPQMHVRIASDGNYLRIEPVSSREQYRWMERFIPLVDDPTLRGTLAQAIDGKGAFRRFKDVLMSYAADRERWFAFRSERLRAFMETWLGAHSIKGSTRSAWNETPSVAGPDPDASSDSVDDGGPKSQSGRRTRNAESLRQHLKELADVLGPRDLDMTASFAEFLRARRAARSFAHHHEHMMAERASVGPASSPKKEDGEDRT